VVFNKQKSYKDLHTERSTSEDDPEMAPWSTPKQQGDANSEFVELEDAPVDKARNIPKGDVEPRVAPLTPKLS